MADSSLLGSLGVLPRPVLLLVLQQLGPADLTSVAGVCSAARNLADDPILWKRKCYALWGSSIRRVFKSGEAGVLTAKEQHVVRTLEGTRCPEPSQTLFDSLHTHWGSGQRPWKRLYQLHGLLQGIPAQYDLVHGLGATGPMDTNTMLLSTLPLTVPPGPREREQMVHLDRLGWEAESTGSEGEDSQSLPSSTGVGSDWEGSGVSGSDDEGEEAEDNTLPNEWAQPQLLAMDCRYYEQTNRSREGFLTTVTCHKGVWALCEDWFDENWQTAHSQGTVGLDLSVQWTLCYRMLPGANGAVGGFYGSQASHHVTCLLDRTIVPVGGTRQRDRAVYTLVEIGRGPARTWVHIGAPA